MIHYALAVFSEWQERILLIASDLMGELSGGKPGSGRGMPPIQPLGLLARPNDPDVDSDGNPTIGAGTLHLRSGSEVFTWPTTDPRCIAKIPELSKGSTVVYACNGALIMLDGQTGNVVHLIPYEENGTKKIHALTFDVENKSIQLKHGDGMGIEISAGGKNSIVISSKAGDKYLEINDEEIVINAPKVMLNGGLVAGDIAGGQGVILDTQFQAWKAAVDAAIAAIILAAGNPIPPGISATAPLAVTASTKVKASP